MPAPRSGSPAVTPLGAVLRGALAQNRLRVALATAAIALGVALGYAVQVVNDAAVGELAGGLRMLSGDADLEVRGARAGFDEALYPVLARLPEVAVASPVVEVDAKLADRDETLRIEGHDAFRAASIQPALVGTPADRLDTLRPDVVFPSAAAARRLGVERGDTLRFQVGLGVRALRVAGILADTGSQRFAVMDIAGAQSVFERPGRVTRIDLRVRPGVDVDALRERIRPLLPPGVAVERPATGAAASARLSRSYRVNLDVLALVALFTGGLLVFSTQALAVVRRRGQIALLRVLGLTRARLLAAIVVEGALVGAAGSVAGLALGFALAEIAVHTVGGDLGSGYFRGIVPALRLDPTTLAIFFALGVATAALGSLAPALEAVRAAPAAALKAGDEERAFVRLSSPVPGVVALVLGGAATALPPVTGLPLFGYAAIALLLAGTLLLMPRIARAALALAPTPRLPAPQLAVAQLRGAPGQASVSLAAVVASVALTVSMAIMVASFRDSLDTWLERILPADLYFRAAAGGDTAYLDPEAQARIAALPGVRRVDFSREQQLLLDPARPRVVLQARVVDAADPARSMPLVGAVEALAPGAPPPAWVNEPAADLYALRPGTVIELPLGGRAMRFTIAGVWRDYGRPQGAIAIARETYVALTGDRTATNGALWLAPGADRAAVAQALQHAVPRLDVGTPGEIREMSLRIFDRTFAVTYALELAAIVIGLAGLSSSFGALVLARRREFGVLRHLGMTRLQIAAMLATEALAVGAIGLAVGLGLGFVISLILIRVVNRQSFHWGMELSLPWTSLSAFALVLLALSVLTALASARRATAVDVVRAVKDDW